MFNPIIASDNIKQSYIDYISTTLSIADQQYHQLFRDTLQKDGIISKGPYLDIGGSFKSGKSLKELVKTGQASPLFQTLENMPEKDKELKYERLLHSHQEEAYLLAKNGNNLVITSGTGSGKTECFLIPVLQLLFDEMVAKTLTRAVRAIIIYPMNALANDQMKRLRKILAACPDIYYGLYNSNTQHTQREALSDYRKLYGDPPTNEVISREIMQESPPHILITNYSMLEYMMLRPKDDAVFTGANLRYIILDEAHVYRGATGIETAMLIRRLKARINKPNNVQYILTSATLGKEEANADIIKFANKLCNATFREENIIRSVEIRQPIIARCDYPLNMFKELYEETRPVGEILKKYNADFALDADENVKLYELMLRSNLFFKLREATKEIRTINEIAYEVGITKDSLVHLISNCVKAVKNGSSLVKVRYHYFLRALEGLYITLFGNRCLYLTRKEFDENKKPVFEISICEDCGRLALTGKIDNQKLIQSRYDFDEDNEFYLINQAEETDFFSCDDDLITSTDDNDYLICPICNIIDKERVAIQSKLCEHDTNEYIKLRKAVKRYSGSYACPACEFGNFRRFYLGYEAATAVIGTALYEQLPEYKITPVFTIENQNKDSIFSIPKIKTPIREKLSRQFISFSDNRADAAFFACYMEKSYQEFLRRRGLWQICDNMLKEKRYVITIREAVNALARYFEKNKSFVEIGKERESQTDICRGQAYIAVINELVSSRRTSGLVQLGKLSYLYEPKEQDKSDKWIEATKIIKDRMPNSYNAERDALALLNLLILDVVYSGALDAGDDFILNEEEREYLFYTPVARKIVMMKNENDKNYKSGWIPRKRTGKTSSFYFNTRITRVMRAMDIDSDNAWSFLHDIWENVLFHKDNTEYALPIQDFNICLYSSEKQNDHLRLYQCEKCGRVTAYNCQDKCVNIKCSGVLNEFDPEFTSSSNHYVNLYTSKNMAPFYIKEHTAQLSRERGKEYQNLFIDKKLNALSCSTTFEMGVDVGSLETVFLRDIPPTPANYIQRAGRAGRSLQSAAYAISYAKLSSHDFTYFEYPEKMITGRIKAPIFELENEKIIRRHINAVALSAFFKEFTEVYNKDNQSELLISNGYEKLKNYLTSKPQQLKKLLIESIPPNKYGVEDWSWIEHLIGENGLLEIAVQDFRDTVIFLENERERCRKEGNDGAAAAITSKLRYFCAVRNNDANNGNTLRRSLIDFLVRNNVLPKYGFPVDTVELIPDPISVSDLNRPKMQRDLQLAIAEYAPGSEIVADGKLYKSRYVNKTPGKSTYNWEYGWLAKCTNKDCQVENYYKDSARRDNLTCPSCGCKIKNVFWHKTIEPRRGFVAGNTESEKPKPVKMRKPDKYYRTDDFYIGDPSRRIINKYIYSIKNNILKIESTTNDSLVVRTRTKFKVCTTCGYSTGKDEVYKEKHLNAFGSKCHNENPGTEFYFAHELKTDVARITFEVSKAADINCMLSTLYALLEAMSKELDIERNDIKGCLYRTKIESGIMVYNLIIYDSVAGGAGHSRRLATADGGVLAKVINRAVSQMDSCDCEPSCYKCLRNYYNQKIHDNLNRQTAADFLRNFIGVMTPVMIDTYE